MKIRIVSYTARGEQTARRVSDALASAGHETRAFALPKFCRPGDEPLGSSASEWARDGFLHADALVFCCASGIAVRAIAPLVKDKTTDPAVLVIDEAGAFVIPLLSGHIGGANALAQALSDALGATPVISTATDVNGLFAVDVFATKNHLAIADMALAKRSPRRFLRASRWAFAPICPFPVRFRRASLRAKRSSAYTSGGTRRDRRFRKRSR